MNVVPLDPPPPVRDVVGRLRRLADAIDAGEHGEVQAVVLVLESEAKIKVRYYGQSDDESGEPAPNAHLLLHCGMALMVKEIISDSI